jgi:hypothetical protein
MHARRAADVLADALNDPNVWVRVGAAKTILERTLPNDGSEPADYAWFDYATEREVKAILRIMKKANARRERGDGYAPALPPASDPPPSDPPPDDALVIDVEPEQ